jgi:ankyrin repeat protein
MSAKPEMIKNLFKASIDGDMATVKRIRDSGIDVVHSRDHDGLSSIILACRNGHIDLVNYLLEIGADPNDVENFWGTCLMAAACYGHEKCVERLIEAGADVNYSYPGDNATVIYMVALCFKGDVARKGDGADVFEGGSRIRTVGRLLDAGAPSNTPCSASNKTALQVLREMDVDGLYNARCERDGMIVLLQNANDPQMSVKPKMDQNLFNASIRGDLATVKRLYESGVNVTETRDNAGLSPIILACRNGHIDLLNFLLQLEANPNDMEYFGGTCLMAAACYGQFECVERLIEAGAHIHYTCSGDNSTVIYMTAYCFKSDVAEMTDGAYWIEEGSRIRTVELLLNAGAPSNTPCSASNKTALQVLREMDVHGLKRAQRERWHDCIASERQSFKPLHLKLLSPRLMLQLHWIHLHCHLRLSPSAFSFSDMLLLYEFICIIHLHAYRILERINMSIFISTFSRNQLQALSLIVLDLMDQACYKLLLSSFSSFLHSPHLSTFCLASTNNFISPSLANLRPPLALRTTKELIQTLLMIPILFILLRL